MNFLYNLTISLKIFLAIVVLNIIGLVAMIILTSIHFKETSEKYHEDRLLRKEQTIIESIDYLLSNKNVNKKEVKNALSGKISEISDINNLDINIYNLEGKLILSSLGVDTLKPIFLPDSIKNRIIKTEDRIEIDSIISADDFIQINSYSTLRNNNQEKIAIINIPYVTKNQFLKEEFSSILKGLIAIMLVLIIGSAIFAWFISKNITKKLTGLANKISKTEVVTDNSPLQYHSKDEIKPIVDAYNTMLYKLKEQTQLLTKIEREDAWREMAKQIAHEVKNPLTPMRLTLQNFQLKFDPTDPNIKEKVEDLTQSLIYQIDVINAITNAFSDFARMPQKSEEEINVVKVTQDALDIFPQSNVSFFSEEDEIIAVMDKIYYTRIITNLVKNALQSIPNNIEKKVSVMLINKENSYLIKIKDNGLGIPKNIQDKIYEPKFTTKNSGMGLGLAMVKKIVEDYNGSIKFETLEKKGTTFIVEIPKFDEPL